MTENKFKKDVADPNVNVNKLNEIFEVDTTTGEMIPINDAQREVQLMRDTIKEIEKDIPDIDGIILSNIERANRFLDKIEEQVMKGNMSASMLEACSSLMNAVTSAATSITGISYNNDVLDIRREELRIREKKITLESIVKPGTGGDVHITNNHLTMTREQMLEELRGVKK